MADWASRTTKIWVGMDEIDPMRDLLSQIGAHCGSSECSGFSNPCGPRADSKSVPGSLAAAVSMG
jgi:hypothetical protein